MHRTSSHRVWRHNGNEVKRYQGRSTVNIRKKTPAPFASFDHDTQEMTTPLLNDTKRLTKQSRRISAIKSCNNALRRHSQHTLIQRHKETLLKEITNNIANFMQHHHQTNDI